MSEPFVARLRRAASAILPKGAMLRRDRDGALYVTDAPRRAPGVDWRSRFRAAGFLCTVRGGLARLTPGPEWLSRLTEQYQEPPDFLCGSLQRFDGPPDEASLRLFAQGLKALEAGTPDAAFERLLRQRAAVCLRDPARTGGGLYACSILLHLMKGGIAP